MNARHHGSGAHPHRFDAVRALLVLPLALGLLACGDALAGIRARFRGGPRVRRSPVFHGSTRNRDAKLTPPPHATHP